MDRISVIRYGSDDLILWNEFLRTAKNSIFMFDRNYMEYHSDRFKDHSLLFYCGNKLVAIFPASEHGDTLRSHGGLTYGGMITNEDMRQSVMMSCFEALSSYCMKNGITSILYKNLPAIYHKQPAEEDIYALYYYGARIEKVEASTVIKLGEPIKMSKLRRRQASKALRSGVQVVMDDSLERYNEFMKMQDEVLVDRHNVNAVHSGEEMHLLHARFPENIHLYIAKCGGQLVGGSIIFIYDEVVHTQYLCANEKAKDIGALDATIIKIIEDYKDNKKWLDFGISTEDSGHFLNLGLVNQKEGFGGRTVVYQTWMIETGK